MACNDWIGEACVGLHVGQAGDEEFQFVFSDCARPIGLQTMCLYDSYDTATGTQYKPYLIEWFGL